MSSVWCYTWAPSPREIIVSFAAICAATVDFPCLVISNLPVGWAGGHNIYLYLFNLVLPWTSVGRDWSKVPMMLMMMGECSSEFIREWGGEGGCQLGKCSKRVYWRVGLPVGQIFLNSIFHLDMQINILLHFSSIWSFFISARDDPESTWCPKLIRWLDAQNRWRHPFLLISLF